MKNIIIKENIFCYFMCDCYKNSSSFTSGRTNLFEVPVEREKRPTKHTGLSFEIEGLGLIGIQEHLLTGDMVPVKKGGTGTCQHPSHLPPEAEFRTESCPEVCCWLMTLQGNAD